MSAKRSAPGEAARIAEEAHQHAFQRGRSSVAYTSVSSEQRCIRLVGERRYRFCVVFGHNEAESNNTGGSQYSQSDEFKIQVCETIHQPPKFTQLLLTISQINSQKLAI